MPTVTATEVTALAHCPRILEDPASGKNKLCPGYRQVEVAAIQEEVTHTFRERGGDLDFPESTHTYLKWADPDESFCPFCSTPDSPQTRELSLQVRPVYQRMSGHDPMGLLDLKDLHEDPEARAIAGEETAARDDEVTKLRETVEKMGAQIAALTADAPKAPPAATRKAKGDGDVGA